MRVFAVETLLNRAVRKGRSVSARRGLRRRGCDPNTSSQHTASRGEQNSFHRLQFLGFIGAPSHWTSHVRIFQLSPPLCVVGLWG